MRIPLLYRSKSLREEFQRVPKSCKIVASAVVKIFLRPNCSKTRRGEERAWPSLPKTPQPLRHHRPSLTPPRGTVRTLSLEVPVSAATAPVRALKRDGARSDVAPVVPNLSSG